MLNKKRIRNLRESIDSLIFSKNKNSYVLEWIAQQL